MFPDLPPWDRRRRTNIALMVLFTAVTFALIVGAMIYWANRRH